MAHSAIDIFSRVIDIMDPMELGGFWHELHQTLRPFVGPGLRIEIGLHFDHRPDQMGVDSIAVRRGANHRLESTRGHRGKSGISAPLSDDRPVAGTGRSISKVESALGILVDEDISLRRGR